jgi:ubiquitin carboxyl-terminal hydrolase 8
MTLKMYGTGDLPFKEKKYNLTGLLMHFGNGKGGHYVSISKNFVDDQWYHYDDEIVRPINLKGVLNQQAYILFYQKVKN